jgi:hypothetical protein
VHNFGRFALFSHHWSGGCVHALATQKLGTVTRKTYATKGLRTNKDFLLCNQSVAFTGEHIFRIDGRQPHDLVVQKVKKDMARCSCAF